MDVFNLRNGLVGDYAEYIKSFINISDTTIAGRVSDELDGGLLWPEPLLQLNPSFEAGPLIDELVEKGTLHPKCGEIFKIKEKDKTSLFLRLHRHQADAIEAARSSESYVLTTGTGSGKSLSYIIPIVDYVVRKGSKDGRIKAIIIYPMNALANSQALELEKFLQLGFPEGGQPVRYARYTGQEKEDQRNHIKTCPPDILLTNYVMMELLMTRPIDKQIIEAAQGLQFLVLDELHTYRGRQGADVALLVRRIRDRLGNPHLRCVGTSATLAGGGTFAEQQVKVAEAASRIFGTTIKPVNIIGETLKRATNEWPQTSDYHNELRRCVARPGAQIPSDFETFKADALAHWIESTFGLLPEEETGRLKRATPVSIRGEDGAAANLSKITGLDQEPCAEAIEDMLLAGYSIKHPDTGFPLFAFRLHQFISRGDTIYASLDPPSTRFIHTEGQHFVPGDRERILFPLAFCRVCGQEYYVVRKHINPSTGAMEVLDRELADLTNDGEHINGFLYHNPENPWPGEVNEELLDRLPEEWLDITDEERRIKKDCRKRLPEQLPLNTLGQEDSSGTLFVFTRAPFPFCLNCGISYSARIRSDYGKLSSLSSEGRSTATTVLSLSGLGRLKKEESLKPEARKILSFTDNRQDASLQAGHFNDFVEVSLLRAAIFKAARDSGPGGLRYKDLADEVFSAMNLPLDAYAADPGVKYHHLDETNEALREVLGYRIYQDLRRGWRVTAPNLEQCGLLEIKYLSLEDICNDTVNWQQCHDAFTGASPGERLEISRVLLDYLRRELVIKVDFLNAGHHTKLRQMSGQRLVEPWAIDENEELITAPIAFPRSKRDDDYRGNLYVSARGGFGRYLKLKLCPRIPNLKEKDIKEIIAQLFQVLAIGLLQVVEDPAKPEDVPGYQLPASTFIWLAGDGTKAFYDPIRTPSRSKVGEKPNPFFVRFYQTLAAELCDFEAREHTAQVPYEVRIEREDRFRSADLPILFCSPTMELGVDIAQLNAVNMRNVPPTPANYAQRSGRAGRSGQPALVYTYCTTGSPHDQYFFRRPEFMVSGAVSPPRIDLSNEDLIRAHVYAVWLSETGLDLKRSLKDVLDVDGENPTLELRPSIRTAVQSQAARKSALDRLNRILATLGDEVTGADWYYDGWLKKTLDAVDLELEDACERWRGIFKSARDQIESQTKIVNDLSRIQKDRDEAKRLRAEAEAQIELLTESSGYEFSDFYSYRYFAGEGFLPGYNFPRLPLSAFIPGRRRIKKKMDEFISRPRFLAISEFGPRSIIYHEGVRYIINKVILSTGEDVLTTSARLCPECGYLHSHKTDAPGADLCEHCKAPLTETLTPLLKLYNVSTKRRDRINSDEEERQRMGYELKTGVRFSPHSNHLPSRTATVCREDGTPLLTLDYGHSATLWRINLGWRRRQDKNLHGFVLDRERGYWAKNEQDESDLEDPMSPRRLRVIPYVEDTKNALILKPEIELPPGALASLQYAVKNAIQVIHQLEDDELAAEPLPSAEKRQRFLFYEAAEGGAGVLRHLVEDSNAFRLIAQEALRLCHFNPSNGDDERPSCEAACYDCLLSYYNQPEHDILDRREVRDLLLELSRATVKVSPRAVPRSVHLENLRALCDSDLEKSWLEFIESNNLNLPDEVQKLIAECETKPDFFYSRHKTAVFIDGPVHDAADIAAQDRKIEDSLLEYGFLTIRFRYDEKEQWLETCSRFSNVFGKVPQTSNT